MQDVISVGDQYYILSSSALAVEPTHVLKNADSFAVFGRKGDISPIRSTEQGLYHDGTRYVSQLQLRLNNNRPLLLSATTWEDNRLFGADLTNPDLVIEERVVLPRDVVHLFRSRFLWNQCCYDRLRVSNYGRVPVSLSVAYEFAADFRDIFEVRGTPRPGRGTILDPHVERDGATLSYRGLDGVVRTTRFAWQPAPARVSASAAHFTIDLEPKQSVTVDLTIRYGDDRRPMITAPHDEAFNALSIHDATARQQSALIETLNTRFNAWLTRSAADIRMMITETEDGPYPYAGVPWFNTAFGRDGILTALSLLWMNPGVAAGVLRHLASTQATAVVPEQDAEPGKVLHERRGGEMAALGEIPFGRYYGSVDATPLFVTLAGAYYQRTGDLQLIESIWPNIEAALAWIDQFGDLDGDGLVEYARRSEHGLVQQGWKDSQDSVFHEDGRLADPPIALCEVQGYVYSARRAASILAEGLGHAAQARDLDRAAEQLREQFDRLFWCEDLGTYALALDGSKRPCRVRSSNAGHCLFSGIARRDRARRVAENLFSPEAFSGWGIRTLDASEARYNPMSYHNGSVWPHDNALIAAGCARYGFADLTVKLLSALFDVSVAVDLARIPELFCGFHRREGAPPTMYPVACAPQAWSAAAVFLMLQSCLGLSIDAPAKRVSVQRPTLPESLRRVVVRNLRVTGDSSLDLQFERLAHDVSVSVLRRDGDLELVVLK